MAGAVVEGERPEQLAGQGGQGQQRRGQRRDAEGVDVADRPAEPVDEVGVEGADDDAHVGGDAAGGEDGGEVGEVVAGTDDDAAGLAGAGLGEHLGLAEVAADVTDAVEAVRRGGLQVDDDDGHVGGAQHR